MKLGPTEFVYVRSMGKALRITAICSSVTEANDYCERHVDEGVIAEFGPLVFIANLYDKGVAIPR